MKIGIISDIHSNIDALERVFKEFKNQKIEKIICIGDIIGIGPYPEKTIQYLINNQEKLLAIVRGNHEKYLINGISKKNHADSGPMSEEEILTHKWNHSKLNSSQIKFIKSLKIRDCLEVEKKKIIVEHYPMNNNGKIKKFYKKPTIDEIEELFEDENADIYLFGHTHQAYYNTKNNKYYINPGSLGCPTNTGLAYAGIINITEKKIEYEQLKLEYDVDKVIKEIKSINYPLNKSIIKIFYKK